MGNFTFKDVVGREHVSAGQDDEELAPPRLDLGQNTLPAECAIGMRINRVSPWPAFATQAASDLPPFWWSGAILALDLRA